jgi:hypothetical protein
VHIDDIEVARSPARPHREGQLSDLLVIDLSRAVAGPHAAMMLGDLGARVIKVEQPGQGDDARSWGPPFVEGSDGKRVSSYFLAANRNKESITLDLKDADDLAQLRQLLVGADVLIENFRPGTLARLGLTDQALLALSARLVVLAISGFGHDGPEGGRAGYDQIAQGEAGLMSVTGSNPDDPQRVGVPIADILAGVYGAYGVLAALYERTRTAAARSYGRHFSLPLLPRTATRAPPGPWRASAAKRGATTIPQLPRTGCSVAETAPSRSPAGTTPSGRGSVPNSDWTSTRAWRPTGNGSNGALRSFICSKMRSPHSP